MAPEFVKVWSGTADGPAGRASVPLPVEPEPAPEPLPPKPRRRLRPIPPKDTPAVRFAPDA